MKKIYLLSTFMVLLMIRVIAQPTTNAPVPTRLQSNVISVFSDSFTSVATDFNPGWGQSGTVNTTFNPTSTGTNVVMAYTGFNYQGTNLTTQNASNMEFLHIDVWTSANPTNSILQVSPINNGTGTGEALATINYTSGTWTSVDIPKSSFTGMTWDSVFQLKFAANGTGSTVPITIYLDNIYFWKAPPAAGTPTITGFSVPAKLVGDVPFTLTAPTSNSIGAFTYTSSNTAVATISGNSVTVKGAGTSTITATQAANGSYLSGSTQAPFVVTFGPPTVAAPTPKTRIAADVMNYYSSAYTEITGTDWNPGWGQNTVASEITVAGNATRKMANLNYQGAQFVSAQNVSSMSTLHLDLWTPDCNSFNVSLIGGGENAVTLSPTLSGWNSFDIPLSSYAGRNLAAIIQFKFESVTPGTTVYLDNIYFWKAATLPVSLTEFKATKNGNTTLLNWRTESESNNKGFALERSENGIDWTQIQFVNGNGTTSTAKNYFATDNNPINGLNYYRLAQVDYDGKQTNSDPLTIKFSFAQQLALSFYPNPAKNNLTVFLDKVENNDATLELISVEGKKIKTIKLNKQDANNSISIDLKGFDKGIYLLSLKDGANSKTSKLLID